MSDPQPDYDSVPGWLADQWKADLATAVEGNQRVLAGRDLPEGRCRATFWHDPHDHLVVGDGQMSVWVRCPGLAHDHEARCCAEHDHHTTPHKGCVLR